MESSGLLRWTGPMNRRRIAVLASLFTLALLVGLAAFQPWRLVTRSTVDEPPPAAAASAPVGRASTTPAGPTGEKAAPAASARTLTSGRFVDGEHETSGTARLLALADGRLVLRLEGFSTSDGPDVDVWLTDQPAGGDDWHRYDDGRYVPLGDLKGTDGNQNYAIPADTDLGGLTSVVIWCDRFDVAFGSAPIQIT